MTTRRNHQKLLFAKTNNNFLQIKPSQLNGDDIRENVVVGNGIFAMKQFKKGDVLTCYTGWIISAQDAKRLKLFHAHSHILKRNTMTDNILGVETIEELSQFPVEDRGFGSFINHSKNPNVKYENIDNQMLIIALRDIEKDEELFSSYGKRYWNQSFERTIEGENLREKMKQESDATGFSENGDKKKTRKRKKSSRNVS
jgi:SET domain-containing protein